MDLLTKPILIGAAVAAAVGWTVAGAQTWRLHSEQTTRAGEKLQRAEVDRDRERTYALELAKRAREFAAAQWKATELGQEIAARDAEIERTKRKLTDALLRSTDGRECFGPGALGVLNDKPAAGAGVPAPAAAAGRLGDDETAPAGSSLDRPVEQDEGPGATDEDVGRWILDARAQYGTCAKRLKAWQTWWEALPASGYD